MPKRLAAALIAIVGLGYLASDPTPVANAMHRIIKPDLSYDAQEHYDRALTGHEAGSVHWTLELGLVHYYSTWLPEGIEADKAFGRSLIESAMEAGYSRAGLLWFMSVERNPVGLERAARAGAIWAVELQALNTAIAHCSQGALPEGAMDAFLADYADSFLPWHMEDFVPQESRLAWDADEFMETAAEAKEKIRVGIPGHFEQLCMEAAEGALNRILP